MESRFLRSTSAPSSQQKELVIRVSLPSHATRVTMSNRRQNSVVHSDLQQERERATFPVEELTNLLDGSAEATEERRRIEKIFLDDPRFKRQYDAYTTSVSEEYERAIESSVKFIEKMREVAEEIPFESNTPEGISLLSNPAIAPFGSPFFLHTIAFSFTVMSQASDEQNQKWMPLIDEYKIIGCYAQTELGHGNNIRSLETTAIYDPRTEEFILNSPTVTSIKFWPGAMANTSNFAVVLAQLYTKGKCHGLHFFIVQLRSLEDHRPLPGITTGSLGPRMEMNSADNGYMKLDNVRIPREHLLMKSAQVLPDGTYVKPKNPFATYGTMLMIRLGIVQSSHAILARAATVAIRYGAIRRQGEIIPNSPEIQILDYQTQQLRLFPQLAIAYALKFIFQEMRKTLINSLGETNMDNLAELHALTCSMKATATRKASTGVDECRLACGGMGYWKPSILPTLQNNITAACTYEGDNFVLLLQTARFLMKSAKIAITGNGKLTGSVEFLRNSYRTTPSGPLEELTSFFQQTTKGLIFQTAEKLQSEIDAGIEQGIAWNNNAVELVNCAKIFSETYVMARLTHFISEQPMSNAVCDVLHDLFELLGLFWILEKSGEFLQFGVFPPNKLGSMKNRFHELLAKIRVNAVALVDAFDFSDEALLSIIGCYDGQVYERIYSYLQNMPINRVKVHPVYEKYLRPLMKSHL